VADLASPLEFVLLNHSKYRICCWIAFVAVFPRSPFFTYLFSLDNFLLGGSHGPMRIFYLLALFIVPCLKTILVFLRNRGLLLMMAYNLVIIIQTYNTVILPSPYTALYSVCLYLFLCCMCWDGCCSWRGVQG